MLTEMYLRDNIIFNEIVEDFKQKSYNTLMSMNSREQIIVPTISEYATIEFSKNFLKIDAALYIVLTQFLWLPEKHELILEEMKNTAIPLPNHNSNLFYSGRCQMDFFYILPDGFITDDIFVRNEHAEEHILEQSNWFNTTTLSKEEEYGLVRYMRYEYGDLLVDDDGLKANDLTFLGKFNLTKKLHKQMQLETDFHPKEIYVWHYKNNHYAFAYYDKNGVLQYELSNHFPIADYINKANHSSQLYVNRL